MWVLEEVAFQDWLNSELSKSGATSDELEWYPDYHLSLKSNVDEFLHGLELSRIESLPVYVKAYPPGHTDWGYKKVFRHCPRCKADVPMTRMNQEIVHCSVCGFQYNPEETSSLTKMELDYTKWKADQLQE